jgi:hydroxyacylglutathione hydrolase/adenylyltransferase/sulfurtransferase
MVDETVDTALAPAEATQLIEAGATLIDVRRPYEWEGGRLTGARNVEMNELPAASESIDRARPVLFYCRGGNRSGMAADAFREAGYDAYHVAGGIQAWAEQGFALEPEDGEVREPLPPS